MIISKSLNPTTDTTNFNKNLSGTDISVQKALETIDEFTLGGGGGLTNFTESTYTYNSTYGVKLTPNNANTDVNIVLQPKGGGGLLGQQPDGTIAGGAIRGNYAVDLQYHRSSASQVASGAFSVAVGGRDNMANISYSVSVGGNANQATGAYSGTYNGFQCQAAGPYSIILGGYNQRTYLYSQSVTGGYNTTYGKTRQDSKISFQGSTSGTAPTELFIDSSSARLVLKTGQNIKFKLQCLALNTADITKSATFEFDGIARRGTAAVYTTVKITGISSNASDLAANVVVSADTANGSLKIMAYGIAATNILWQIRIDLLEIEI